MPRSVALNAALATVSLLAARTVSAAPQLAFPVNSQVPPVAYAGQTYSFSFSSGTFTSKQGNITYSLSQQPTWLSLDGTARALSGTPTTTDVGASEFQLSALDAEGQTSSSVTLVVLAAREISVGQDILPQLARAGPVSGPATLILHPQKSFSFQFSSSTFDGATTSTQYYATSADNSPLPAWLSFDPSTIVFSGTTPPLLSANPTQESYGVNLVASDVIGFSQATLEFQIAVADYILAASQPVQTFNITVGEALQIPSLLANFTLEGASIQRNALAGATSDAPEWLTFNDRDLSFSGTVPNGTTNTTVTLTVTDTLGSQASIELQLDVADDDGGLALVQTTLKATNATAGQYFGYTLNAQDVVDSPSNTTASLGSLSSWLTFNADNLTLSGEVPNNISSQAYNISITSMNTTTVFMRNLPIRIVSSAVTSTQSTSSTTSSNTASSTSSTNSATASAAASSTSPSTGHIVRLVLAIFIPVLAIILIIAVLLCCLSRRRKAKEKREEEARLPMDTVPPPQTTQIVAPETSTIVPAFPRRNTNFNTAGRPSIPLPPRSFQRPPPGQSQRSFGPVQRPLEPTQIQQDPTHLLQGPNYAPQGPNYTSQGPTQRSLGPTTIPQGPTQRSLGPRQGSLGSRQGSIGPKQIPQRPVRGSPGPTSPVKSALATDVHRRTTLPRLESRGDSPKSLMGASWENLIFSDEQFWNKYPKEQAGVGIALTEDPQDGTSELKPTPLNFPRKNSVEQQKRQSQIPVQQRRPSLKHMSSSSIRGLPNRLSAAGHGQGVLDMPNNSVPAMSWPMTFGAGPKTDNRGSFIFVDTIPLPARSSGSSGDGASPTQLSERTEESVAPDTNVFHTTQSKHPNSYIPRAKNSVDGTGRHPSNGLVSIPPPSRRGSSPRKHSNTMEFSRRQSSSKVSRNSWNRWSGLTSGGALTRIESGTVSPTQIRRNYSAASSRQFDSADESRYSEDDDDLVAEENAAGERHWQTDTKNTARNTPSPRLPFENFAGFGEKSINGRRPSGLKQLRVADPRQRISVEDPMLPRSEQSHQGSFRFV